MACDWPGKHANWNARAILARDFLFHSFNIMSCRSERLGAAGPSVGHVPGLLSSLGGQQQRQLDALLAPLDRETSQTTDEPSGLLSGESTTHGKAFPAIDDPGPDPPSSAYLLDGLPSGHDNYVSCDTCDTCDTCGASTWTWNRAAPSCGGAGGALTRATSYDSFDISHVYRERKAQDHARMGMLPVRERKYQYPARAMPRLRCIQMCLL
ncbi:uncharacterized protein K444DRAFT_262530 [Hyaloscypha bicolor E]|uniref:Uncharacterized protein n=1 Tax=Hyaloscypha bicolor E TaxID=1095630 RepID=A0A2J6SHK7_9HELO|nr:uncharacterized protein K444DRAFT_262530 [Hyaloscypha bicolor E]PMD50227.1 hypothetical protein K444DRAFT_262530 [Hyaloscypha bicolor E]